MVETFSTTPLRERRSENLSFKDYARENLVWGMLPFMSGGAVYLLGRGNKAFFENKIPIIDGSPSLLQHLYEVASDRAIRSVSGRKLAIDEVERVPWVSFMHDDRAKQVDAAHNFWNFWKATEIGGAVSLYHLWTKKEGERLDLAEVAQKLHKLESLKPTDAELSAENASLRQQLEFVDSHRPASGDEVPRNRLDAANDLVHDGTLPHPRRMGATR